MSVKTVYKLICSLIISALAFSCGNSTQPAATEVPTPVQPAATEVPTPVSISPIEFDPLSQPIKFLDALPVTEVSCVVDTLGSTDRFVEILQLGHFLKPEALTSAAITDLPSESQSATLDKCLSEETLVGIFIG